MNSNYAARVARIESIVPIDGADRIVLATVCGSNVIVGRDAAIGSTGLFFAAGTELDANFAAANDLFRDGNKNWHPDKTGMFDENGRVKAIKLKGVISEGFFLPLPCYLRENKALTQSSEDGVFDSLVFGAIEYTICRKYAPRGNPNAIRIHQRGKSAKSLADGIIPGQFEFHGDTDNLKYYPHAISPSSIVSITEKYHGTSAVIGNLLVKRDLRLLEKFLAWLGIKIATKTYKLVWASRRVIKGVGGPKADALHFYGEDVWGHWAGEIGHLLPEGVTVYGEIVGFTPNGAAIQTGYDYGCGKGESRFIVYRITQTSPDGHPVEFTWPQIEKFCSEAHLESAELLYYGQAQDVFGINGNIDYPEDGSEVKLADVLLRLAERRSSPCGDVPFEGYVVARERLGGIDRYKVKTKAFVLRESNQQDLGEVDTETQEEISGEEQLEEC